jgi:hypothetical protein
MVSIEEFKKKLGDLAKSYSEEELVKMKNDMSKLADLLFDEYLEDLKKTSKS